MVGEIGATQMVKIKSGGGISSNRTVQSRNGMKVEPVTHKGNVSGVAQQGRSLAFARDPITQGKGYEPGKMTATGLRGTYNPATQGPSSQRTTYKAGSQSATPSTTGMPAGRNTLAEFGPDSVTARNKR